MKNFKFFLLIITVITYSSVHGQNFVDDIYFNDSEVDYSFLYINEIDNATINDSSEYDNSSWDEEVSYETRIQNFNNSVYSDYYWDYGWNYPSWGWNLNYHNYGWGVGGYYGSPWAYNWHHYYPNHWHNHWHYSYGHYWSDYYYPGHYHDYGSGGNHFIISSSNNNISYGHRDSNNTNVIQNNDSSRSPRDISTQKPNNNTNVSVERPRKPNNNTNVSVEKPRRKKRTNIGRVIDQVINNNTERNYKSSNQKNRKSNNNRNYNSTNRNYNTNSNKPSRSSNSNRSGSGRGNRN